MVSQTNRMAKIEWSAVSTKIGIISGILGIIISGTAAFKIFFPKSKDKLDDKSAVLSMSQLEPRLEMSYVIMESSIYYKEDSDKKDNKKLLFLDYPLVTNEIARDENGSYIDLFEGAYMSVVTYLVIQNTGKATPGNVKVSMKRYMLNQKISVDETNSEQKNNYYNQIVSGAADSSRLVFDLPTTLETGNGVLIPLFVVGYTVPETRVLDKRKWDVISKIVYLPDEVIYTDPLDEKEKKVKIRMMKDPVRLVNGIEGRG
jgi:hypothetical protein